jgi:hypothetical protein
MNGSGRVQGQDGDGASGANHPDDLPDLVREKGQGRKGATQKGDG